jgi:Subtilisin inhibitor-like
MRRRRLLVPAVALALVAGIAAAALALAASPYNVPRARAEARRLLGLVSLPPGAQPSTGPPAGSGTGLSTPASVSFDPHLVDLHAFFTFAGTPEQVMRWATAHRPAGSRLGDGGGEASSSGGGTVVDVQWETLELGSVRGRFALRDLVIEAAELTPSSVGIRIDAQVAPAPKLPRMAAGPGSLRILASQTLVGSLAFTLSCSPPGGTLPNPARACAAIHANHGLLYSFPGRDHSCPFGAPDVSVRGTWGARRVHASFSVCTGGQEQLAADWARLLPSTQAELSVAVDRGIGLVSLGDGEQGVLQLLRGTGRRRTACGTCTVVFGTGASVGYGGGRSVPLAWTIAFTDGRVSSISANFQLTIGRLQATAGFASLRRHLHGWTVQRCGPTRMLVHASAGASTAVVYGSAFERVIVADGPAVCGVTTGG